MQGPPHRSFALPIRPPPPASTPHRNSRGHASLNSAAKKFEVVVSTLRFLYLFFCFSTIRVWAIVFHKNTFLHSNRTHTVLMGADAQPSAPPPAPAAQAPPAQPLQRISTLTYNGAVPYPHKAITISTPDEQFEHHLKNQEVCFALHTTCLLARLPPVSTRPPPAGLGRKQGRSAGRREGEAEVQGWHDGQVQHDRKGSCAHSQQERKPAARHGGAEYVAYQHPFLLQTPHLQPVTQRCARR